MKKEMKLKQRQIINALDVRMCRDTVAYEDYLEECIKNIRGATVDQILKSGCKGAILGLSGGLDSFVVGAILATVTSPDFKLTLVAMPKGSQHDFDDVLASIEAIRKINPNVEFFEANIGSSVRALHQEINNTDSDITMTSTALGNVSARMRMVMQYALASNQLVIGTDHATEAVVGYYTKYGDGGVDFNPIGGFLKDELYDIAELLGAPESVMTKKPAAGLGITDSDEDELGLSYINDIVPFLKGARIDEDKAQTIISKYNATQHKREMPLTAYNRGYQNIQHKVTHVVIDCCKDFVSGSLACKNANVAVSNIVNHINNHPEQNVLYVQEMHPANHCSFKEQGGIWPAHCVEYTDGVELPALFYTAIMKDCNTPLVDYNIFRKGGNPNIEEYSGFNAFSHDQGYIHHNCEKTVFISGIATEYCVKNTVVDFINAGYNVIIKEQCLAYVDEEAHIATLKEFIDLGVTVIYN